MLRKYFVLMLCVAIVVCVAFMLAGCSCTRSATDEPTKSEGSSTSSGSPVPQADKVTVPDVVDLGFFEARTKLSENNLETGIQTDPPNADLQMSGTVVVTAQDPAAGTVVDSGSKVKITLKQK